MRRSKLEAPPQLESSERRYSIVAVAYKTVEMFEGLTNSKLWLKNNVDGEATTNGHLISVPFRHPEMYQLVEYQLAHVLFKSDATARLQFAVEYTRKVEVSAKNQGFNIDNASIRALIDGVVGTLEAERVLSLWGLVYEGSVAILRRMRMREAEALLPQYETSLTAYFVLVATGIVVPEPPKFSGVAVLFERALEMVRFRGFDATLVTAKWLVAQLVSKLMERQGLPDTGAESRSAALKDLVESAGDPTKGGPNENDFEQSSFDNRTQKNASWELVEKALSSSVKNDQALEATLDQSRAEMTALVEKARSRASPAKEPDEWLRKDAMAKVVFRDILAEDIGDEVVLLSDTDREAVARLRAQFVRVIGKNKTSLEDMGSEIDIPAYIERRLTGMPLPVFRTDVRGRGFSALMLMDRSGSMKVEQKTENAQRAVRVINRALRFPFVTTQTWGFQSLESGQLDLTRYANGLEVFDTPKSNVGGVTPLHLAIRVATRQLVRSSDKKHLFVVTDGRPVWRSREGRDFSTDQLFQYTREAVILARQRGVNVIGVLIGTEVTEAEMRFMFGPQKFWRRMSAKTFGRDLVRLVTESFIAYLAAG